MSLSRKLLRYFVPFFKNLKDWLVFRVQILILAHNSYEILYFQLSCFWIFHGGFEATRGLNRLGGQWGPTPPFASAASTCLNRPHRGELGETYSHLSLISFLKYIHKFFNVNKIYEYTSPTYVKMKKKTLLRRQYSLESKPRRSD